MSNNSVLQRGRPLKELPVKEIATLYKKGATIADLAIRYNVGTLTIRTRLIQQGVSFRRKGPRKPLYHLKLNEVQHRIIINYPKHYGYLSYLAKVFGVSRQAIWFIRKRENKL